MEQSLLQYYISLAKEGTKTSIDKIIANLRKR